MVYLVRSRGMMEKYGVLSKVSWQDMVYLVSWNDGNIWSILYTTLLGKVSWKDMVYLIMGHGRTWARSWSGGGGSVD